MKSSMWQALAITSLCIWWVFTLIWQPTVVLFIARHSKQLSSLDASAQTLSIHRALDYATNGWNGGVVRGEDPVAAASRELSEELGLLRMPQELTPLATISVRLISPNQTTECVFYLFTTKRRADETLRPSDDLDGIAHLDTEEMYALVDRFFDLADTHDFQWSDYGKLYGKIHQIAMQTISALNSKENEKVS